MYFEIIGLITDIETMAVGSSIRDLQPSETVAETVRSCSLA